MTKKNEKIEEESLSLSFLGFKIETINPSRKSILIIVVAFIFFIIILSIAKFYLLPALINVKGKSIFIRLVSLFSKK